jgi:hypothetical protein
MNYIVAFVRWWIRTWRLNNTGLQLVLALGTVFVILCPLIAVVSTVESVGRATGLIAQVPTRTPTPTRLPTLTESPPTRSPTSAPSATAKPTSEPPTPTIALPPTDPPAPTVVAASGPSPELRAYFGTVGPALGDIGTSLGELGKLLQKPQLTDNNWKIDVAVQLATIRKGHETIKGAEPVPPEAQELHTAIVDATTDCDAMTYALTEGLDKLNASKLQDATRLMQSCAKKITDAKPLLAKFTNQ